MLSVPDATSLSSLFTFLSVLILPSFSFPHFSCFLPLCISSFHPPLSLFSFILPPSGPGTDHTPLPSLFLLSLYLFIPPTARSRFSFVLPNPPPPSPRWFPLFGVVPPLQVVGPSGSSYPSAPTGPGASGAPFSWVPRQMLSGDVAEEEGESDGDSDRGEEERGEGEEAELVIDIPNE